MTLIEVNQIVTVITWAVVVLVAAFFAYQVALTFKK